MSKSRIFMIVLLCILLPAVGFFIIINEQPKDGEYTHPVFKTEYTKEEHIQRISARTEELFAEEIEWGFLVEYKVDIIHAFYDDDPEWFLIEIEYQGTDEDERYFGDYEFLRYEQYEISPPTEAEKAAWTTRYAHLIGFIQDDNYFTGWGEYSAISGGFFNAFIKSKSVWKTFGYENAKKYCGYWTQAVQTDEGILQLYNGASASDDVKNGKFNFDSVAFTQKILDSSEYKFLMENQLFRIRRLYKRQ